MTVGAGATVIATFGNLIARGENALIPDRLFGETGVPKRTVNALYRTARLVLLDLPQENWLMVANHEIFGHGARLRERFDASISYHIDAPFPLGHGGGSTSFGLDREPTTAEWLAVSAAGMEVNAVSAGLIAHRGRLSHPAAELADSDDLRLPVVPDVALRGAIDRRFELGAWTLHAALRVQAVGPARLSFDPELDRRIPARQVVGLGISAERSGWKAHVDLDNALNSHADSFGFGNPFSVRITPQRTPIRPRGLSLTISRRL
jgi:hypothetical protein